MDSSHGSSCDDGSSQNNPKPLLVSGRNLNQSSVVSLKLVENGWYEMKTIDNDGKVEFHYGERRYILGTSSSEPLTYDNILVFDDTAILSFEIFILLQHSIFANPRYCNSWFKPEKDLKWNKIEGRDVVRVKNSDSWFETVTDDERGKRYHYAKAGELIGNWYSRSLPIEELETLDDSNMLVFDMFCSMQEVLLSRIDSEGTFSITSMLRDILDRMHMFSVLEQTRTESEENYLRTTAELENVRIGKALTEFTSGMKNGTIDPVEIALHKERIISDLEYVSTITGRDEKIENLLGGFLSEFERIQGPEIVQPQDEGVEVKEAPAKSRTRS